MTSRFVAFRQDAADPGRIARFWADLLGREQHTDADGVLLPGDATQVALRFTPRRAPATGGPNRVHLHLTSAGVEDQPRTVAAALRLGARHLDLGQRVEEGHVVLADPEGHAFCVVEAGNAYLEGCGLLGELACDGTRDVGLFWSQALGWPLVWDQDQETAVQSPRGGTKVSWGGEPVTAVDRDERQGFLVAPVDLDQRTEVDRLVALGAARLGPGADGVVRLTDPDGVAFSVLPG